MTQEEQKARPALVAAGVPDQSDRYYFSLSEINALEMRLGHGKRKPTWEQAGY